MLDKLKKYQHDMDVFSSPMSAKARSLDLGMGGAIHVYDLDGQAYYMPGPTHQAYLQYMAPEEDMSDVTEDRMMEALRVVVDTIMGKSQKDFKVLKVDEEQRIIYGWASVTTYKGSPVVDLQDEYISTETLHKAINEFMKGVRVGKVLHRGEPVGQIVHSFPMTKDIMNALEIQCDKEGWITGYYVEDDELWKEVKAGNFAEFSIGGRADKREFNAN